MARPKGPLSSLDPVTVSILDENHVASLTRLDYPHDIDVIFGELMATLIVVLITVLALAYANGANDNFKGVATLFGSGTTNYRKALTWATLTTLAGSLLALYLAHGLVDSFKGKGLVPDAVTQQPTFLIAVALGAALTVLIATITGMPVSTTHALTGALVGAGLCAAWGDVAFSALGKSFVLPLLCSPLVALLLTITWKAASCTRSSL